MSKHMQEPWPEFVDICEPATPHPDSDGIVRLGFDDYQRAARCVNACRGVENNQLMVTSVSGAILMLREAQLQRDELLAALESASAKMKKAHSDMFDQCLSNPVKNAWGKPVDVSSINDLQLESSSADKLIAKAKGGAA